MMNTETCKRRRTNAAANTSHQIEALVAVPSSAIDECVHLNVGGRPFMTTRATLTSCSGLFATMFSGRWASTQTTKEEPMFLDRDPEPFAELLSYLRTKDEAVLASDCPRTWAKVAAEFRYFCVDIPPLLLLTEYGVKVDGLRAFLRIFLEGWREQGRYMASNILAADIDGDSIKILFPPAVRTKDIAYDKIRFQLDETVYFGAEYVNDWEMCPYVELCSETDYACRDKIFGIMKVEFYVWNGGNQMPFDVFHSCVRSGDVTGQKAAFAIGCYLADQMGCCKMLGCRIGEEPEALTFEFDILSNDLPPANPTAVELIQEHAERKSSRF